MGSGKKCLITVYIIIILVTISKDKYLFLVSIGIQKKDNYLVMLSENLQGDENDTLQKMLCTYFLVHS